SEYGRSWQSRQADMLDVSRNAYDRHGYRLWLDGRGHHKPTLGKGSCCQSMVRRSDGTAAFQADLQQCHRAASISWTRDLYAGSRAGLDMGKMQRHWDDRDAAVSRPGRKGTLLFEWVRIDLARSGRLL